MVSKNVFLVCIMVAIIFPLSFTAGCKPSSGSGSGAGSDEKNVITTSAPGVEEGNLIADWELNETGGTIAMYSVEFYSCWEYSGDMLKLGME